MCPQMSRKGHCSLGEALNPDVSLAVRASCSEVCKINTVHKYGF